MVVIVNRQNENQKMYLTKEGNWDHRIQKAKKFESFDNARQVFADQKSVFIEMHEYKG